MYKKEIEQFLNLRSKLNEFSRDFFERYEMCIIWQRKAPLEESIRDYVSNCLSDNDLRLLGECAQCDSKAQAEYIMELIAEDLEILEKLVKLCKG